MPMFEFRLPELGEGLHEGRIAKWLVQPGDTVAEDDAIAEVENDKAVVELPSPVAGKVLELKVSEGTTAVVGDLLITLDVPGSQAPATAQVPDTVTAAVMRDVETAAVEQAGLEPVTDRVEQIQLHTPAAAQAGGTGPTGQNPTALDATAGQERAVLATPGVRKYAREQGVDIARVTGSGVHGKITRADVETFVQGFSTVMSGQDNPPEVSPAAAATAGLVPASPSGQATALELEERVSLTGIRQVIAQAMVRSMYTAPHVTVMDEVDVTELVRFRNEVKPLAAERGVKMTYLPFVVKALVAALKQHPTLNASLDDERKELVLKHYYHIGVATDTDRGLLVPVVRNADAKNMWTVAREIEDLANRARNGKLGPGEMKGSTISITNIGSAGGLFFTPIINYPEVAILGTGRITERPIMKNGQVVGAQMMALSLSFDHRVVDGGLAQRFINDIKRLLENPRLLLLEV